MLLQETVLKANSYRTYDLGSVRGIHQVKHVVCLKKYLVIQSVRVEGCVKVYD